MAAFHLSYNILGIVKRGPSAEEEKRRAADFTYRDLLLVPLSFNAKSLEYSSHSAILVKFS